MEGQTGLYVLFKTVCDNYELLPAENYKLPPEAEGLEPVAEPKVVHTILKADPPALSTSSTTGEEDLHLTAASRTNTRRHIRSSPSTGAAVTTVIEADEEESDMALRLKTLKIKEEEEAKQEEEENIKDIESSNQEPAEELAEMTVIVDEAPEKASEEPESAPEIAKEQEGEDKIEKDDSKPSENASEPKSADEKKVEEPKVEDETETPETGKDSEKEPLVHTLNLDEETPAEGGEGDATVTL